MSFQISSVTSMSFLTDPNLTFHRFSDGTISCDGRKTMPSSINDGQVWTTNTVMDYSTTNPTLVVNESARSTAKILSPADETAEDDKFNKRFSTYSSTCNNSTASTTHPTHSGSTMKLIQVHKEDADDSKNKQVRNCGLWFEDISMKRGKFNQNRSWLLNFQLKSFWGRDGREIGKGSEERTLSWLEGQSFHQRLRRLQVELKFPCEA